MQQASAQPVVAVAAWYDEKCCDAVALMQVLTSNAFLLAMVGILAAATIKLGPLMMFNLYFVPYWINVVSSTVQPLTAQADCTVQTELSRLQNSTSVAADLA
jgi:hypothetical protein